MRASLLYCEVNAVCILFLLLLCVKVKKSMFLQSQRNLLFAEMVSNIIFFLLDAAWIFADGCNTNLGIAFNWALNIAYYLLSGIVGFLWFRFSETVQESVFVRKWKYYLISAVPAMLLIVLTLITIKTGWLFYIDANGQYHRGPLYFIQLLVSYGYVIFTAIKALVLSLHSENYRRKTDLRTLSLFVVPTIIAGTLQTLLPNYPILCIGNTVGILYVYITLQEQLVSVDALTKLNNRNQMYQYLSGKLARPVADKALYLFLMDVDSFKSINDKFGHVEGDRALKKVAERLMKVCGDRNYFLARYGGDEFIVICELDPESPPDAVCDAIHAELEQVGTPYQLSVSIGFARYVPEIKTQQELIALADEELYKNKPQKQ